MGDRLDMQERGFRLSPHKYNVTNIEKIKKIIKKIFKLKKNGWYMVFRKQQSMIDFRQFCFLTLFLNNKLSMTILHFEVPAGNKGYTFILSLTWQCKNQVYASNNALKLCDSVD